MGGAWRLLRLLRPQGAEAGQVRSGSAGWHDGLVAPASPALVLNTATPTPHPPKTPLRQWKRPTRTGQPTEWHCGRACPRPGEQATCCRADLPLSLNCLAPNRGGTMVLAAEATLLPVFLHQPGPAPGYVTLLHTARALALLRRLECFAPNADDAQAFLRRWKLKSLGLGLSQFGRDLVIRLSKALVLAGACTSVWACCALLGVFH